MDNNQNKPQDNVPKVEFNEKLDYSSNHEDYDEPNSWDKYNTIVDLQCRIAELEAELRSIKDTIEKDPVSFILVHALKYLNNENKLVLLEKLGRRTNLTELAEQALKDNG